MAAERSFSVLVQIQGAQQAASQMQGFTGSLQNASNQITSLGVQVDRSTGSFSKYTTTLNASGRSVQTRLGPLNQFNVGLKTNVNTIDQNVSAHSRLNAAMGAGIGFFTSSLGAVGALASSFMQLERAGTQLESMHLRLQKAQLALSKATEDVNKLTAAGKQGTLDYSQAVEKQKNAQDAVTLAEDRVNLAQSRLSETQLSFVENIIPQTIQGVGGIIAGFSQMSGSMSSVSTIFSGLIPQFGNLNKGSTLVKDALMGVAGAAGPASTGIAGLGSKISGL